MAAALPWLRGQFTDGNGKPLAGGKVWTYFAGTTVPVASYTDSTGAVPNANPYILDADGRSDIWLAPGSYKVVLMDKNDVVIWTKDKVKPADGGGGGIVDSDYIFDGYSARFSEQFGPTTGLLDTLNKIIIITYTAPAISLGISGSGTVREKGAAVTAATMTATVTKRSNPIGVVRFYYNGGLVSTQASPNPAGGNETYNWTGSFTDNKSFSSQVDDTVVGVTGPTTVTSNTVNFTFVYPYFYGAGAAGLGAAVAGLTKDITTNTNNYSRTITSTGAQKLYVAYPASYGVLTSILDASLFEVISTFTRTTVNITGLDATSQSYYVYESNSLVIAGSFAYQFKK